MSDPREITIRAQVLEGQWEVIGKARLRGIVPENVQLTVNEWGPDSCSFTLNGDPGLIRGDLSAWTPIEVDVAGRTVWDGRIKETPTQDSATGRIVNVQAEGWQYHLDDDVYTAAYVRSRLSEWQDVRSNVLAYLPSFTATPQVNGGTLQWAIGASVVLGDCVGIMLDCGADSAGWAKRISVDWTAFANSNVSLVARCADVPGLLTSAGGGVIGTNSETAFTTVIGASGTVTQSGTFATPHRYVALFLVRTAATATAAADYGITITGVRVYSQTAYESGNQSILKADTIIKDAVTLGTKLLSTDTSGVQAGTFSIPEHAPGLISPREAWQGANAYENYDTRVEVGRKPVFRPRPTSAIYEIGEWAGADFSDASANSSQSITSRVLVQGTGPDAVPLTVERMAAELAGATLIGEAAITLPNPSFDVNATGWTIVAGATTAITRTTTAGEFDSSPGGGKVVTDPSAGGTVSTAFSGTFRAGLTYVLRLRARMAAASFPQMWFGDITGRDYRLNSVSAYATGAFVTVPLVWTPKRDTTAAVFQFRDPGSNTHYLDSLQLSRSVATLADRRNFRKTTILPVGTALTTAVGQRLGDLYLTAHKTTPFRGGFQTVGTGGLRRIVGGASPHPAWLLLDSTQLVRCPVVDVDTGNWTRDARMVSVSYDHDSLTSTIALDEDREGFDALLARYALIVGQRQ